MKKLILGALLLLSTVFIGCNKETINPKNYNPNDLRIEFQGSCLPIVILVGYTRTDGTFDTLYQEPLPGVLNPDYTQYFFEFNPFFAGNIFVDTTISYNKQILINNVDTTKNINIFLTKHSNYSQYEGGLIYNSLSGNLDSTSNINFNVYIGNNELIGLKTENQYKDVMWSW
jgi:hypothetical protein